MNKISTATLSALFACSVTGAQPALAGDAEVLHWWVTGGQSTAIKVFADAFEKTGNHWIDTGVTGGDAARALGTSRIIGGNPPTVMQFNTGKQIVELVNSNMLNDVEDVATAGKWRSFLPKPLTDATTFNGKFYAVPVNVHGEHWIYWNKAAFAKVSAPDPDTWDHFFEAADKLKAAGIIPLALGGQNWQERLLFDATVISFGGPELFEKIYRDHDEAAIRGPAFRKAVDIFVRLRSYVDAGSPGRNWNDATNMVMTGQAGMQIHGDWMKGEYYVAGKKAGVDFGCIVGGPGEHHVFTIGGDVFVFPKTTKPEAIAMQKKMAEVMISPDVQVAFNNVKGSVPVRGDVDTSKMDACAQEGLKVLNTPGQSVASVNLLASPNLAGAIQEHISTFWNTPTMKPEAFIDRFVEVMKTTPDK